MPDKSLLLEKLHRKAKAGVPIIGAGAGVGLSARAEALGGADLMIAYSTGKFRMAGASSVQGRFAASDANKTVVEMMRELVPVAGGTPVLAGVFVQDPFCDINRLLSRLEALGCMGVQNIPGMGGMSQMESDEVICQLNALGLGFDAEVEFIRRANALGFLTTPYCSRPEHIEKMAKAGADIFVLHMGLTGRADDKSMAVAPLEECAEKITYLSGIAHDIKPDAIILAHGGPIVEPADLAYLMKRCPRLHGFYGASSIERIPAEVQTVRILQKYKALRLNKNNIKER